MKRLVSCLTLLFFLAGCTNVPPASVFTPTTAPALEPTTTAQVTATQPVTAATARPAAAAAEPGAIPNFDHIILIVFENHSYEQVYGSEKMPYLYGLIAKSALLTEFYAITHPSLPNYLALAGGDTFGVTTDCKDCFTDQPSLADRLEAGGRTWRAYLEGMPGPCMTGNHGEYVMRHNPFVYFTPLREDTARCNANVVPLTQLTADLKGGTLPNFVYIMPNMCNSGHDCQPDVGDGWLKTIMQQLQSAPSVAENSLIIITFDESLKQDTTGCCGIEPGGGHILTVLVSPHVKAGVQDSTPYNHYSTLKTILMAWGLPDLGHTADPHVSPFSGIWQ